ncbi:hypothetical protein NM688_g5553 [Phlebia brevispora]|uniref:Uncharacterized protein n=1 Tax=Phlebia brevispora TaxID=194682 RepID=A0ACC1STE0_9APHY|nr:hypothetical protein NM688_g5553 [Phlebia brevispora]
MYSQASASTAGYWELEGDLVINRGEVPPVPAIPVQYQAQPRAWRPSDIAIPPPPQPKAQPGPGVERWQSDAAANDNTLDSNPFDKEERGRKDELRDSLVYSLPSLTHLSVPIPTKTSSNNWFATNFASQSSPSTSPSPTTAYIYPTHPAYPPSSSHPAEAAKALPRKEGDVMSVRDVQASRSTPQYGVVHSQQLDAGERGSVGYQLPSNWRVGHASRIESPPEELTPRVASFVVQ